MNPYILDVVRGSHFASNISLLHNCLYIHIPKCAGNSIKASIGGFAGDSHVQAKQIPVEMFERFYSFSFVRNPFSRCVSAYFYLLKGGKRNIQDLRDRQNFILKYKDFDDFVLNGLHEAAEKQIHFLPQHKFLEHRNLDFIGKLENIRKDFFRLSQKLKIDPLLELKNTSIKPCLNSCYSKKVFDKVAEIYEKDFNNYKYPLEF